jgi:hypothetical protein
MRRIISLCHSRPSLDARLASCSTELISRAPPSLVRAISSNDFVAHAMQVGWLFGVRIYLGVSIAMPMLSCDIMTCCVFTMCLEKNHVPHSLLPESLPLHPPGPSDGHNISFCKRSRFSHAAAAALDASEKTQAARNKSFTLLLSNNCSHNSASALHLRSRIARCNKERE